MAQQNVAAIKAEQRPTVSLSAGTTWNGILPQNVSRNAYLGLSTSWNLFDNQVTKSQVKKAETTVESAEVTLQEQEDAVELAVKENYLGMKEAEKRSELTEIAIQKAQEDYSIASAKYQVGEGTMLDVLDTQLALSTAKNNYIKAQYDYAAYKAKLDNSMGMN